MRRHLLALLLVPVFIAGMILAAPPATADHSIDPPEDGPVQPASEWPDTANLEVTITGADFVDSENYVCTFGNSITTDSCEFTDVNTLTATINIEQTAAPGERIVEVTHEDGSGSSTCDGCFTVNGPTEVDPPEGEQGEEELEVDISGAGFDDADADSATCDFGEDIDVGEEGGGECDIVVVNEGEADEETIVRATISVSDEAEESARDVTVTIFDDTAVDPQEVGSGTCQGCFTVAAAQAEPTLTPTPTATATAVPTGEPIDTDDADTADSDADLQLPTTDAQLPDTGVGRAQTYGIAGLVLLGSGLVLLRSRRRWVAHRGSSR